MYSRSRRREDEKTLTDLPMSLAYSFYANRYVLRNQKGKLVSTIRLLMQNHALEEYV